MAVTSEFTMLNSRSSVNGLGSACPCSTFLRFLEAVSFAPLPAPEVVATAPARRRFFPRPPDIRVKCTLSDSTGLYEAQYAARSMNFDKYGSSNSTPRDATEGALNTPLSAPGGAAVDELAAGGALAEALAALLDSIASTRTSWVNTLARAIDTAALNAALVPPQLTYVGNSVVARYVNSRRSGPHTPPNRPQICVKNALSCG